MPVIPSDMRRYKKFHTGLNKKQLAQVKRIARSKQEIKRVCNTGTANILEGQHIVLNPLYNITQGVTNGNRVAGKINLDEVRIDFTFDTNGCSAALFMYAYWSDVESITSSTNPTTVTSANVFTTLPFLGAVSSEFANLVQFDNFQCIPLRQKRVAINPGYNGGTTSPGSAYYSGSMVLKFKGRKMKYLHDSASYFEGKNLYIGFAASRNGVVDTDIIGTMFQSTLVTWHE